MGAGQSGGMEIGGSSMGYQVLRVYPNSPGSQAGLKAYFDFIVAIGNTRFSKEDGSLREILKASVDQKLKMIVFNTRNKQAREVEIVPTTSWGGSGLLGVSIKHSSFDKADERVWHVVEVDPGSPASQAGLKADEDYVIGSDSILQESDDLYNLIEAHEGKALKLFVYNSKSDNCREVICQPNSRWGGRGFLGCEFGHGLLHRIPYSDNQGASVNTLPTTQQSKQLFNGTSVRPPNVPQQQQHLAAQMPMQPGHQMFQQALFNQKPQAMQTQLPQQQASVNQHLSTSSSPPTQLGAGGQSANVLPRPSEAPQTFAQLANAQSHTNQEQLHNYQEKLHNYQQQHQQNYHQEQLQIYLQQQHQQQHQQPQQLQPQQQQPQQIQQQQLLHPPPQQPQQHIQQQLYHQQPQLQSQPNQQVLPPPPQQHQQQFQQHLQQPLMPQSPAQQQPQFLHQSQQISGSPAQQMHQQYPDMQLPNSNNLIP